MSIPRVSMIVPLYNKGGYILSTLQSIIDQTVGAWEAIIVDNGSTDEGPNAVRRFADGDSRIRLLAEDRRGPGAARNHGLLAASGEWVLFVDADDLLRPYHLERLLAAASENRSAQVIAGGQREFVDGSSDQPRLVPVTGSAESLRFTSMAFAPWQSAAAMIRRTALTEDFHWAEELDPYLSEDTAFWFRLLQFHQPVLCENDGLLYRLHARNSRNEFHDLPRWLCGLNQVYGNNLEFARKFDLPVHWRHCESLMRSYDAIRLRATEAARHETAREAGELGGHWLRRACLAGGGVRPELVLRQLLGRRLRERVLPRYRRLRGFVGNEDKEPSLASRPVS